MAGALLGGYLADRLGKRDKRWYLWVPALAGLLAVPIGLPFLLSDNTIVVLMTIPIVVMLQNTYIGPVIAVSHALVPPAMRALTSAILFFILNLIGLGLGPLTVGLLSDAYQAHFGVDSLRYAMLTAVLLSSPSILLFFLGARRLRADLDHGTSREGAPLTWLQSMPGSSRNSSPRWTTTKPASVAAVAGSPSNHSGGRLPIR